MSKSKQTVLTKAEVRDREERILRHVARYRLTTTAALHKTSLFADRSLHVVHDLLKRLTQQKLLIQRTLSGVGSRAPKYYALSKSGAHLVGVHECHSGPLKQEARARAYAFLAFCLLREPQQERLTREEFDELYPGLFRPGQQLSYYIDIHQQPARLCYLRVDFPKPNREGRAVRWDRLLDSLSNEVSKRQSFIQSLEGNPHIKQWRDIIQKDRFGVTVLTCLDWKAQQLQQRLDERFADSQVRFEVQAMPELKPLLIPEVDRGQPVSRKPK